MSIASDEVLRRLTGTGAGKEYTVTTTDEAFSPGAPAVEVLVLAGTGALSWTTPDGAVSTWGNVVPMVPGDHGQIVAAKIHGTAGTAPASSALTLRVRR